MHAYVCVRVPCAQYQVHRDREGGGGESDEALVEVTGNESARKTAQELIDDIISSQDFRGDYMTAVCCDRVHDKPIRVEFYEY